MGGGGGYICWVIWLTFFASHYVLTVHTYGYVFNHLIVFNVMIFVYVYYIV